MTHAEAAALSRQLIGKGITQQSYALRYKIFEVDALLEERVIEVHPEVSFHALAKGQLPYRKKSWNGFWRRWQLLTSVGIDVPPDLGLAGVAPLDDIADAAVGAWSANRYASGQASRLPENPPTGSRSRAIAIWY
jgi:predicted RNase H-like nuclease